MEKIEEHGLDTTMTDLLGPSNLGIVDVVNKVTRLCYKLSNFSRYRLTWYAVPLKKYQWP